MGHLAHTKISCIPNMFSSLANKEIIIYTIILGHHFCSQVHSPSHHAQLLHRLSRRRRPDGVARGVAGERDLHGRRQVDLRQRHL